MNRATTKTEISKQDLEEFVKARPHLKFDGLRYTEPVKIRGLTWNRPVAFSENGKHFLIERRG